jgi:hypothetical protein
MDVEKLNKYSKLNSSLIGYSIYKEIITRAKSMNCDQQTIDDLFWGFGEAEHNMEKMAAALSGIDLSPTSYEINIPTTDFSELVIMGNYDRIHKKIHRRHFIKPGVPNTKVNLEIMNYNKPTTLKAMQEERQKLESQGFRGANIYEILTFGIQYPEVQREFPILAMKAETNRVMGYKGILSLQQTNGERHLDIVWGYGSKQGTLVDYSKQLVVKK